MQIKVNNLSGYGLSWALTQVLGWKHVEIDDRHDKQRIDLYFGSSVKDGFGNRVLAPFETWNPLEDYKQRVWLLEKIYSDCQNLRSTGNNNNVLVEVDYDPHVYLHHGKDIFEAAFRCAVEHALGDVIEIPDVLMQYEPAVKSRVNP